MPDGTPAFFEPEDSLSDTGEGEERPLPKERGARHQGPGGEEAQAAPRGGSQPHRGVTPQEQGGGGHTAAALGPESHRQGSGRIYDSIRPSLQA